MIHIPTWLDMLLLLVAFVMTGLQHGFDTSGRSGLQAIRFILLVVCFIMMPLTVFLNSRAGLVSAGLGFVGLACVGAAIRMQMLLPPKQKPNHNAN